MATSLLAISVDGSDIPRLAQFWADVLGRPVNPGATASSASIDTSNGLRLMFHQVPEGKVVKNRVHPDLGNSDYDLETDRLIGLGAVKLNDVEQGGTRWRTFADPEGNEFDLVALSLVQRRTCAAGAWSARLAARRASRTRTPRTAELTPRIAPTTAPARTTSHLAALMPTLRWNSSLTSPTVKPAENSVTSTVPVTATQRLAAPAISRAMRATARRNNGPVNCVPPPIAAAALVPGLVRWAAQVTTVPRMLKPIRTPAMIRNFLLLMMAMPPLRG